MNRHVYCLTYNKEQGVSIESLAIEKINDKEIELSRKSHTFPDKQLPFYNQYRIQQLADNYGVWCIDRENISKMKETLIHELSKDLKYYQKQSEELKKVISEVNQLTTEQWEIRE